MGWEKILAMAVAGLLIWITYRNIKGNPELFSRLNLGRSFSTMGFLAIGLIGFVGLCIYLLRVG
jgi:hypothetical protein